MKSQSSASNEFCKAMAKRERFGPFPFRSQCVSHGLSVTDGLVLGMVVVCHADCRLSMASIRPISCNRSHNSAISQRLQNVVLTE